MELDLERIRENARKATTVDLLDRATVYRSGMESEALRVIEEELTRRGVTVEQVEAHLQDRKNSLTRADGTAIKCSYCRKPATVQGWGWQRLFGRIPIFPRLFAWCAEHAPANRRAQSNAPASSD